jgi:hypothetical protein
MLRPAGARLAAVLAVFVLAACSGNAPPAAEELDALACDELGFPCSWADVSDEAFDASMRLLDDAGDALGAGEDPTEVAARLAADEAVVAATHDETGVQFRVDGAPPVVAFAPAASPLYNAVETLAAAGDLPLLAAYSDSGGPEVVAATYGTTRQADLRPRSALVIRPWEQFDLDTLRALMVRNGLLEPDEEPDWDQLRGRFDGTASVLRASEHLNVVEDSSVEAFAAFRDHDLVLIQTHSSTFGSKKGCDPAKGHVCGPVLGGPVLAPAESGPGEALEAIKFQQLDRLPAGATVGKIFDMWTVAFTPDYFAQQYGTRPHRAVLIINACKTGDESIPVTGLTAAIGDAGSHSTFAWTNAIDAIAADATTAVLAGLLVDDALPAELAMRVIERSPSLVGHLVGGREQARLIRLGSDRRVRDAATVQDRGARMEPGAVIQVDGDPGDGKDDVIRTLSIRVDGALVADNEGTVLRWWLKGRHGKPIEVERPFTSGTAKVQDVSDEEDDTDTWRDQVLTFERLDLEFDLERDDLVCCREHTLIVELENGDGEVARHQITPVFLRHETVEVLDPEFGQPLTSGDRVAIAGKARDGLFESYPLIVSLENFDASEIEGLVLEVLVNGDDVSIPASRWKRVGDGRYRVELIRPLHDFTDDEESIVVEAWVELPERGEIRHTIDPLILELPKSRACDTLSGADMTAVFGRSFAAPTTMEFGFIADSICMWEGERDYVQISMHPEGSAEIVRGRVRDGDPASVDGFGDAAVYDTALADPPSGIETDGEMNWTNSVNLSVALGDHMAIIHVQGNIVVEEGVDRLLARLADLVRLLRSDD